MNNKSILITLCARSGSKGVKNKNITLINNVPLIAYSIKHAQLLASQLPNVTIALSTDGQSIKDCAAQYGISTNYTRPQYLANDTAGKLEVLKDILLFEEEVRNIQFDYLIDLDISSPLRKVEDVVKAFELVHNNPVATNIYSVSAADKNPYFNMVELNEDGFCSICKPLNSIIKSRQASPKVYALNASFYVYKRTFFDNTEMKVINSKSLLFEMKNICFDIDEPIDVEFMNFLLSNNKVDFDL